jgi:septal ring factor EnvC (AmiA/AmiB activator)
MRRLAVVLALALSACLPSGNTECKQELQSSAEKIRALEMANKKLADQNAEQGRKIDALLAQLVAASDESTRASLQKRLDAARAEAAAARKNGVRPACNCQPSDPLCSCL